MIKQCPCGKAPEKLCITGAEQGGKWANVDGGCCGYWTLEFRTSYYALDSKECMEYATQAWNEAPRFWETP